MNRELSSMVVELPKREVVVSDVTGTLTPLLENYERKNIKELIAKGKKVVCVFKFGKKEVSDPVRKFFYGHVFYWVTAMVEKYAQEDVLIDKQLYGKRFLNKLYELKNGKKCTKHSFLDVDFETEEEELSYSKKGDMEILFKAVDIWTLWFAEKLGETFPIPDPLWRINQNAKDDKLQS